MITNDKRLFNFRPLVLVACCFVAGILVVCLMFTEEYFTALITLGLLVLVVAILNTQNIFKEFVRSHKICVFACIIVFVFSSLIMTIRVADIRSKDFGDGYIVATATVCDVDGKYLTVQNINADFHSTTLGEYVEGKKMDGKIKFKVADINRETFKIGDDIAFKADINFTTGVYSNGSIDGSYFVYGIIGRARKSVDEISKTGTTSRVATFTFFKNACKNALDTNLSEEMSGVAYAMLFGDKSGIEDLYENFKLSGVAHLLAVSGLHIGFFAIILSWIAKLLKFKNLYRFIFVVGILFVYAWICNFSTSVMRAFIMCTIAMFAGLRGKQYDSLNALAFSAIFILFINPFYLLNIGFQLSFMSVLFILLLMPVLTRVFSKKLPKSVSQILAMTISAQAGALPILVQNFPEQSALSIVANLLAVPLAEIGFMGIVITLFPTLIFSGLGFLMKIPEFALNLMTLIAKRVASMTHFVIAFLPTPLFIILSLIFAISISDYIFFKKQIKLVSAGMLCVSYLALLCLF